MSPQLDQVRTPPPRPRTSIQPSFQLLRQMTPSFQSTCGMIESEAWGNTLQEGLLRCWRRRVHRSLMQYLVTSYGIRWKDDPSAELDIELGRDCIRKAGDADWWEWRGGSTLFYWSWPPYLKTLVTQGHHSWLLGELPRFLRPQHTEKDQAICSKVRSKLENVLRKGCISKGPMTSLTSYFAVPKGTDDIWLVYDASPSG
jgi:hypothetical protein